jgi:signal transduction histidine kinase
MAFEGVKSDPRSSDARSVPSTERVAVSGHLPEEWLDRLLLVLCQARADRPFAEAAAQILNVARELCDDVAFGVCIPQSALPGAGDEAGQVVIRAATARVSHPSPTDPTMLFPELAYETWVPFLIEDGATLHAASDDKHRFVSGSPAALLLERLAPMLASLVENQRAVERSRRDLRAQVIQAEKLASLGQIAAGIVHELNNPLTIIMTCSEWLRKKLGSPTDAVEMERLLSRIDEAVERIRRFSRDLTAYSRPATEVPAPVAIHEVIERALGFCEHELEKTGVIIEKSFGEVRPVRGVAGQLTQVFVNLFTNAAHAMRDEGGLLAIVTTMTEGPECDVIITVTDDGHGIDAENRARIFEPFFTTKTDGSGTGLGLSIVRSIVLSHGGNISVDSNEPRGTVFQLALPAAASPPDDD